jgi:hypothetical protein
MSWMCASEWGHNKSIESFVGYCRENHQVKDQGDGVQRVRCEDESWVDKNDTECYPMGDFGINNTESVRSITGQ